MNRFTNDPEGLIFFKNYLQNHHFTDIIIPEDEYNSYDIEGVYNGKKYRFEIKLRPIKSTQWNDSIIELYKYNILSVFDDVYIVNLFTDCFHIHPLRSEHELQTHQAQRTNNWSKDKIKKILVSYKNTNKTMRSYD